MSTNKTENIFLFVPNLIGYGRIILAIISFWYMPTNYIISSWCYAMSVILDSIDGHAARKFIQCTKFGAMLDQLTDRCGTMGLLVTLSYFYPKYMFLFQLSMAIDVASHWLYMQTSIMIGKISHKAFDVNENIIMKIYYQKHVNTLMCMTNEVFYTSLYLLHFTSGPELILGVSLFKAAAIFCAPFAIFKSIISIIHAYVACKDLSIVDIQERQDKLLREASKRIE